MDLAPGAGLPLGRPPVGTSSGTEAVKPPHIPPPQIPDLRFGTLLKLRSGEWSHCHKLPDDAYCDLKVTKVYPGITREEDGHTWVWVAGHGIECSWDSSDCSRPCIELLVRVDALQRHAG